MPSDQQLTLECQSEPGDALKLRTSSSGAYIIVSVVGQNVFVEPAALVIAAFTLANDAARDDLRQRLTGLLHPGPR